MPIIFWIPPVVKCCCFASRQAALQYFRWRAFYSASPLSRKRPRERPSSIYDSVSDSDSDFDSDSDSTPDREAGGTGTGGTSEKRDAGSGSGDAQGEAASDAPVAAGHIGSGVTGDPTRCALCSHMLSFLLVVINAYLGFANDIALQP